MVSMRHFNQMLINMLSTLPTHAKRNWQEWVSTLTSAYSCTTSMVTGFSLYFLMYGRYPRLPIDVEIGVTQIAISWPLHKNYAQKPKAKLKWAYKVAKENNAKESECQKKYYNKTFHHMSLYPLDLVLVRGKAFSSDHKIGDKWADPTSCSQHVR